MTQKKYKQPTVKEYLTNQVIFKEKNPGNEGFIIKKGEVELAIIRDGKKVVLDVIKAGECFGEMAPVVGGVRTATATAQCYVELYVLEAKALRSIIDQVPPFIQVIMKTLMRRLKSVNDRIIDESMTVNPFTAIARILFLYAHAYQNESFNLRNCVPIISELIGIPTYRVKAILKQMANINLLKLTTIGRNITVAIDAETLIENTQNIVKSMGDSLTAQLDAQFELIELDELAQELGVDRTKMLKKLLQEELPEELFVFRRSEARALLQNKGASYFEKRKIKNVEDFDELNDIEFLDLDTISLVFNALAPYDLARLLKIADDSCSKRILGTLSKRMRGVIEKTMGSIDEVDEIDMHHLQEQVLDSIKKIKRQDK